MPEMTNGDEPEVQPDPVDVQPDHPDTIGALKDIGARVDLNDHGRVWRIFFYERNVDDHLAQIHGLSDLKEIWLLGTKVTPQGVGQLRERLPDVKIHY